MASEPLGADPLGMQYDRLVSSGIACDLEGNLVGAKMAFREAIALKPHEPTVYFNLAQTLQKSGDVVEAVQRYLEAQERFQLGSEEWAMATARAFYLLQHEPACAKVAKPAWCCNDDGLTVEIASAVIKAAETEARANNAAAEAATVSATRARLAEGEAEHERTCVPTLEQGQFLALFGKAKDALLDSEWLGLRAKRSLACTCSELRPVVFEHLRQPRLAVQVSDATFDNAQFVASVLVPQVPEQALCVAGETFVPEMRLAHLRTLPRLKVGTMRWPAALFFGAAIAESESVLRLADGVACKSLKPLRENKKIDLGNHSTADLFAMLGALRLNQHEGTKWENVARVRLDRAHDITKRGEKARLRPLKPVFNLVGKTADEVATVADLLMS